MSTRYIFSLLIYVFAAYHGICNGIFKARKKRVRMRARMSSTLRETFVAHTRFGLEQTPASNLMLCLNPLFQRILIQQERLQYAGTLMRSTDLVPHRWDLQDKCCSSIYVLN